MRYEIKSVEKIKDVGHIAHVTFYKWCYGFYSKSETRKYISENHITWWDYETGKEVEGSLRTDIQKFHYPKKFKQLKKKIEMKSEKGIAALELAIAIPFYLILIFGVIDIFFLVQKHDYLSVAVREAGNAAYRQCSSVEEGYETTTCLQDSLTETVSFLSNNGGAINGTNIIVRSWTVSDKNPVLKGEFRIGNETSKYSSTQISRLNSYNQDLRKTIVIVEVFLDNTAQITPFFSRNLYETMIF